MTTSNFRIHLVLYILFGVVLLEMACRRRPVGENLVDFVWDLYRRQDILQAADKRLNGEYDAQEMKRMLIVGLWCAQQSYGERPKISQVISVLKYNSELLIVQRPSIGQENNTMQEPSIGQENNTLQDHLIMYDLNTIREATNNFSDENKLGEGGFGQVFKATLLNGGELAVKRLATTSDQGIMELKNEVELIGRIKHRNLVKILGYCIQEKERLLCYEYLPNRSLDDFLFATDVRVSSKLDWKLRFKIIEGICRGLFYLHEDSGVTIVHRDLKPANILLDKNMNPKISDFGTSKLFDEGQTHKIITNLVGTIGYIAPEYYHDNGVFTAKSDVFSFGVIVLETVTGVRWKTGIISHIWRQWSDGKASELKDRVLPDTCLDIGQVELCVNIGLLCVNINQKKRPSISEVNRMLNGTLSPFAPEDPRG